MEKIIERADLAALQIFEEIGLSKHSIGRVSEIIAERIIEQKAIDEEVRLKKCDDMTEAEYNRETAFADWYLKNGKGTPTYSDAIEWVRKDLLDKVCVWLDRYLHLFVMKGHICHDALEQEFRKAMEKELCQR